MILDWLLSPILATAEGAADLLPTWNGSIPGLGVLLMWIGRLDSILPITGPLTLMVGLLVLVLGFITVRLILTVVNIVWP